MSDQSTDTVPDLEVLKIDSWTGEISPADRERAVSALEGGQVVYLPRLPFALEPEEREFLRPESSDGKAKNISYDPSTGTGRGGSYDEATTRRLNAMLARYAAMSERLVKALCVDYAENLRIGRTSYRPAQVRDRASSYRKDDKRLHVDAFPSSPMGGRRILRVFSNVNPEGLARVWHVGEPFEAYARRFLPQVGRQWPGTAWAMQMLRITKGRRTPYDHIMLQLHDLGKADEAYQKGGPQAEIRFPPGTTWMTYTDSTLHAALIGQYAFEQTFYLDPEAMRHPELSPLRVLERLTGHALV